MKRFLGRVFGLPKDVFAEGAAVGLSVHPQAIVIVPSFRLLTANRGPIPSLYSMPATAATRVAGHAAPEILGAAIRAGLARVETVRGPSRPPAPLYDRVSATETMRAQLGLKKGEAVWKDMVSVSLRVRDGRLSVVPMRAEGPSGGFMALPGYVQLWRDLPIGDADLGAVAQEAIALARAA